MTATFSPPMEPRIVVFGPATVGKTWLIRTYLHGEPPDPKALDGTILDEFANIHAISNTTGRSVAMTVVDTGGLEAYRVSMELELERCSVGVCVYDVNREYTLAAAIAYFLPSFAANAPPDTPLILVGNRVKLRAGSWSARERAASPLLHQFARTAYLEVSDGDAFEVQRLWCTAAGMIPARPSLRAACLPCVAQDEGSEATRPNSCGSLGRTQSYDSAAACRSCESSARGRQCEGDVSRCNSCSTMGEVQSARSTPSASPRNLAAGCMVS